jgi:hypothetical protein
MEVGVERLIGNLDPKSESNERKTKPWIPTCHSGGELKSMTTEKPYENQA